MKAQYQNRKSFVIIILSFFLFSGHIFGAGKKEKKESFKDSIILADYKGSLPEDLLNSNVIFIGENHTEYSNHVKQLDIIKEVHKKNKKIAVGMEMFSSQYQDIINEYIAGKITEFDFLKRTNYFSEWGYDFNYYKDIVDFIKSNKLELVGLNIKNEIVHKIGRNGFRELDQEEFKEIPDDMDFSMDNYKQILGEVFVQHANHQDRNENNFYFAQLLRDEYMANSASHYLAKHPGKTLIVLAGNGHIENGYGIPARFKRLSGNSYKTVLLDFVYSPDAADYFIYTRHQNLRLAPRLKIMLTIVHNKIKVTGFYDGSDDKTSPLKINDEIISLGEIPVKSVADIRLSLYKKKAGDIVSIKILRDNQPLTVEFKLVETIDDENEE